MAEQPAANKAPIALEHALPKSTAKSPPKPSNPAFRMMGIPNFRFRLPSRNWLIFLSITGSFTGALMYDRYHKRKAQRRWCQVVSHLADETLAPNQLPRTIAIFLSAPPGDGLRAAREHFHEYIKPILVAGALDWEVLEGRREGEVRAGLASKIRRIRRRNGEHFADQGVEESVEDRLEDFRRSAQVKSWDGVQGDLILGRHTWKEYVRGIHEGWLGPLDSPTVPEPSLPDPTALLEQPLAPGESLADLTPDEASQDPNSTESDALPQPEPPAQEPEKPPDKPPPKISPTPPYIIPTAYTTSSLSPETPSALPPTTILPFPHLLGFLNTPTRIYRFLNRRHLADETGRLVATMVLASNTRTFDTGPDFVTSADPNNETSPPAEVVEASVAWEQEKVLADEEAEWHKSAWAPNPDDAPDHERPWQEKMSIDERIGTRMRVFDLDRQEEEERIRSAEMSIVAQDRERRSRLHVAMEWLGLRKQGGRKGWEMGLVGEEDE
ncbi:MAG: hypothetical protein Q9195_002969 [Heterodermia aff. obscurata]